MKKKLFFAALLSTAVMVSCDKSDVGGSSSVVGTDSRTIIVGVGVDETRITVSPSDTDADGTTDEWTMNWETEDTVMGWYDSGNSSKFEQYDKEDDPSTIYYVYFKGDAPASATTMRFIYPYDANFVSGSSYSIDLTSQSVDMIDLVSKYNNYGDNNLYMMSQKFDVAKAETTSVVMDHILAALDVEISVTDLADGESYTVDQVTISNLYSSGDVSFEDGTMSSEAISNITLVIDNASSEDIQVGTSGVVPSVVPFSVIPFSAASDMTFDVDITFTNGDSIVVTKSIPANTDIVAGTFNSVDLSFAKSSIAIKSEFTLADFDASANLRPTIDPWVITDHDATSASSNNFTSLVSALSSTKANLQMNNITSLPANALQGSTALQSIEMTELLTIGEYAFGSCISLTTIESADLPKAVTIGANAFNGSSLTTAYFGAAESVGASFAYNTSLTTLTLGVDGNGVKTLASSTFSASLAKSIDLTIKVATDANFEISGNTLTCGGSSVTFNSITVQ
ncbi:MAG: leucine-rich repeat protein [Rikenellaceae bacterium]